MKCYYNRLNGRCVIEAVINGKKLTFNQKCGESLTQFLVSVGALTEDMDD